MSIAREFAGRATWFPGAASPAARKGDAARGDDGGLVTNAYLWSSLPLADQAALREINVTLTGMAIEQCASDGGAANQVDFGSIICRSLGEFALHDVTPDELLELSADHDVVFPWSLLYGNARTPFNFRLTRLPLAVAYPRTVNEVVFWVDWVRDHRLSVSIRSGNNSYEGFSSENRVVIDLSFLTLGDEEAPQFRIDADAGLVHTAPGVRLGVLYTALAEQGLALAGGQCAPVCVGGLVGTGGIGFATRAAGWACDQLEEVECVLADGRVVVANDDPDNEDADLFRACKGAGAAGLCVMTRLTLRIRPVGKVLFYSVWFNLADYDGLHGAARVLEAWQNLAENAPDGFSSLIAATASADGGPLSMLSVQGEYFPDDLDDLAGPREALNDVLRLHWLGLLPDELQPDEVEIVEMGLAEAGTAGALLVPMPAFNQWKLKTRFTFRSYTAEELAPAFEYLRTPPTDDPTTCVGYFNAWLMGGVSNRLDPESAAIPVRDGAVMWVHSGAQWNDPAVEDDALAWVEGQWEILDDILQSTTALYGCAEIELGSQTASPPDLGYLSAYWTSPTYDAVPFLLDVKRRYDAEDVFRFSQSIPLVEESS